MNISELEEEGEEFQEQRGQEGIQEKETLLVRDT